MWTKPEAKTKKKKVQKRYTIRLYIFKSQQRSKHNFVFFEKGGNASISNKSWTRTARSPTTQYPIPHPFLLFPQEYQESTYNLYNSK